jgi:hypothetical protein
MFVERERESCNKAATELLSAELARSVVKASYTLVA